MSLPNFHKVSVELYRGAQPDRQGFKDLVTMGVHTTINLRSFHIDYFLVRNLPLVNHHIWVKAWHLEGEDIDEFLRILSGARRMHQLPVFIHCLHGADRTGMMVAIYRIRCEGWTKEAAIREMTQGPFGYNHIWDTFLIDYIRNI